MSEQYSLYDGLPPHQKRDTSLAAAIEILDSAQTLRGRVWRYIKAQHDRGATDEEIQQALGMGANTERPRRRELELMGLVVDSGLRRLTASGRKAVVWIGAV